MPVSINRGASKKSPLSDLADMISIAQGGLNLYKGLSGEVRDYNQRAEQDREKDAASPESETARADYGKALGSPIADTVSLYQLKQKYGPFSEFALSGFKTGEQSKRDIEKLKQEHVNKMAEIAATGSQARQTAFAKGEDVKRLPPDKVLSVNEGNTIPNTLADISQVIDTNSDSFGPIQGRMSSINPYNEKAATIEAQMRSASQMFGRYMEGGVLRKEDEEKYLKMFPKLSDTPDVAKNKLAIVDRLLKQKQASNIEALRAQGYDVSGVDKGFQAGALPGVLQGKKGNGSFIDSAHAGGGEVRSFNGRTYMKVRGGWKAL